jgi:hypothetical protein
MADQGITGRSRSDPPPISFQELRAKRRFHSGNAFAHGSESQVHALGAFGEAALLHYGQEQPHIRQIEAQFFSFGSTETTHRKWPIVAFGR